jgi:hypothetical protein
MALNVNEVVNGRIYSVVFAGPVSMNAGGRMGVPPNPLLDLATKRTVMSVQACSRESYARMQLRKDPTWTPDTSKPSGYSPTEHPCIDTNNTTGDQALRGRAVGVTKHEVFIAGRPATDAELATIAAYQPGGQHYPTSKPKAKPEFMRLPLAKIEHEGWIDSPESE